MILKKPYAFLIKHFRLINLILTVLSSFIMYKTYHIFRFFNEYVKNDYLGSFYKGFYQNYISFFLILALILTLVGIFLILLLFIYKKKPLKIYASSMIYYILLFIVFIFVKNTMINMETNVITVEYSRIIRDVMIISLIPQLSLIISFLIRGLGFNIHKFNFEKDLKDLEISNEDNEEVEITIKNDGTKVKRTIRRFFREFSYYIKENKIMFVLITVSLILIIGFIIYKNLPQNYDASYKEGELFNVMGINYNLEDSMLTNMDYNGNVIAKDYYFLVIRLTIENNTNSNYKFDYKKFKLEIGDKDILPTQDLGINFIDFSPSYQNDFIKIGENETFSLVFKVDKDDLKTKYRLKVDNDYINTSSKSKSRFIYVTLRPEIVDDIETVEKVNVEEYLDFSDSNLGNTSLKFTDLITTKKYTYTYESCFSNGCERFDDQVAVKTAQNSWLFVLGFDYSLDENAPFAKTSKTVAGLVARFARIYYLKDSKMIYSTINNRTPVNLTDRVILEVTNNISSSKEVYISLIIRNKEYLVRVK